MNERYFSVSCSNRSYTVMGGKHTTIDTVWASQRCFFLAGTIVTIVDDLDNTKTFVA